jgi:subtilase family serine protease
VVSESNENNNTRPKALSVGPDLVMSALVAPSSANAGARITVTNTAKNQGGSGARSSITKFYLSTNGTFGAGDVLLGSHGVPSLAAGATNTASTVLTIPAGTPRGTYFLLAMGDATKLVIEARENNNTRSRVFTIP